MKKIIVVFGLLAGIILVTYIGCLNFLQGHVDNAIAGYAAMIIAFSFIYVGARNYRDKYNQGNISFGKAFLIGLGISLVGSTLYVAAWLVDFYCFMPDFMDKYAAAMTEKARHSGLSPQALKEQIDSINNMSRMYKNPFIVTLMTYAEVLPVGIVISLITALIVKRRKFILS